MSTAERIAAHAEFSRLEQACADNALAVERIFRQIAAGDLSPETDAAADALFDAGEAIVARMQELEAQLAVAAVAA